VSPKTIEIRLLVTEEEFRELKEGIDRNVIELAEEIAEGIDEGFEVEPKVNRLQAAQNARCKLHMSEPVPAHQARG